MSILIIGASGFVGSLLYKILSKKEEAVGTFCNRQPEIERLLYLDITDRKSVEEIIREIRPHVIILTSALTHVEYCEDHQQEAYNVNVLGTANVVMIAKEIGAKLVFFSSEYIFNGEKGPYSEIDIPNPINYYGKTKLEGETVIINNLNDYLIIRTTVIYGYQRDGKNFIMQLIQKNKTGQIMNVPIDQYGSPTFRDNLVEVVIELIKRDKKGIYNVVGPEIINRFDFSILAADILGLDKNLIISKPTVELGQKAKRPLKAGLKIDKVKKEIGAKLLSPKEGLEILKKQLEKNF
jgi:dTDP-4-dehydrorhamnose reductase